MLKSVACSVAGFTVAAAMATSAPALAEGLLTPLPPSAYEPVVPISPWNGIYIGFQGGYAWGDSDWRFKDISHFNAFFGDHFQHHPSGAVFGGQVGFNKQTGRLVWGLEASVAGADIGETSRSPFFVQDRLRTDVDLIWTATGRVGYDWGRVLTYVKGGYAGARVDLKARDPVTPVGASADEVHNGWTAGGGVEYLVTPQVVFGVDYAFYDFGDQSHRSLDSGGVTFGVNPDVTAQVVTARLTYKFTRELYVAVPYK